MKRITKKRWFGPKYVGWGPAPKSWEGWVVTVDDLLTIFIIFNDLRSIKLS